MRERDVSRRVLLVGGLMVCASTALMGNGAAQDALTIKVHRDPSCSCCGAWVDHLRAEGFTAEVIETPAMDRVKSLLGVPQSLASCHSAEIGGYVIEGHVPASAIRRLLNERPDGKGLAVPGMPVGSPGMMVEGSKLEVYSVVLFGPSVERTFAIYRGLDEIHTR